MIRFPNVCQFCRRKIKNATGICLTCQQDLPWITHACQICSLPLLSQQLLVCTQCQKKQALYDKAYIPFRYEPPISQLIGQLKFHQRIINAKILSALLLTFLQTKRSRNNLPNRIIPIPLHKKRIRKRGFNQAILIAKWIANKFNVPLDRTSCQRVCKTKRQSSLIASERQQNIKNAFRVIQPIPVKHIAIIDDVMTTGHTINEFSKTLRQAGVKKIEIWCCARAVLTENDNENVN